MANLFYSGKLKKVKDSSLEYLFYDAKTDDKVDEIDINITVSNNLRLPKNISNLPSNGEIYSGILNINNFQYVIVGRRLDENEFDFLAFQQSEVLTIAVDLSKTNNIVVLPINSEDGIKYQNGAFGKIEEIKNVYNQYFAEDYEYLLNNIEITNDINCLTDEKLFEQYFAVPKEIITGDIVEDSSYSSSFFVANFFQELQLYVKNCIEEKYGKINEDDFEWDDDKKKYLKSLVDQKVASDITHVHGEKQQIVSNMLYYSLYNFYNCYIDSCTVLCDQLLNFPNLEEGTFFEDTKLLFVYGVLNVFQYEKSKGAEALKLMSELNISKLENNREEYLEKLKNRMGNYILTEISETEEDLIGMFKAKDFEVSAVENCYLLGLYETYQKMFYQYRQVVRTNSLTADNLDSDIDINNSLYAELAEVLKDVMELDAEVSAKNYYKDIQKAETDGDEMLYDVVSICNKDIDLASEVLNTYKYLEDDLEEYLEKNESVNKEEYLKDYKADVYLKLHSFGFDEEDLHSLTNGFIVYTHIAELALSNAAFCGGLINDAKEIIQFNKDDNIVYNEGEITNDVC